MQWKPAVACDVGVPGLAFETWVDIDCIVVVGTWIAGTLLFLHAARNQLPLDLVVHPLRQHALGHQLVL